MDFITTVHSRYYDDGYIDSTAYYDTLFKTLPSQRVILHRSGEQVKPRLTPHDGRSGAVGGGIRTHDILIMSHSPYWFGHRRSSSQILGDIDSLDITIHSCCMSSKIARASTESCLSGSRLMRPIVEFTLWFCIDCGSIDGSTLCSTSSTDVYSSLPVEVPLCNFGFWPCYQQHTVWWLNPWWVTLVIWAGFQS